MKESIGLKALVTNFYALLQYSYDISLEKMTLKWFSKVTVLLVHLYFNIVYSKYIIQIDFNFQFDVPNQNHNVSSKMTKHKLQSSGNKKLISNYKISPRYKLNKARSRSLAGK